MNPISLPPKLAAALVTAQKTARGVEKDAKNSYHDYKYASSESLIDEGRRCLLTADLALFPTSRKFDALDLRVEQTGTDKQGKPKPPKGAIGRVEMKYMLAHASGEAVEVESGTWVVPEAGRPEDKAEAAAVTSDLGYVLRGLLLLPRGMDTTPIDARDDRDYTPHGGDDRAPPADDRAPSDRPARSPGDHAAAAQTGVDQSRGSPVRGPAADVPQHDPAYVTLCEDFERQAKALTGDPAPLYNAILGARLPEALDRRALFAVVLAAFRLAPSVEALDHWRGLAKKIKWGEPYASQLKEAFELADARLSDAGA